MKNYTRFVMLSKKLAIIVAILLLIALILPFIKSSKAKIDLTGTGTHEPIESDKSMVSNPKFYGVDDEYNKYEITAIKATEHSKEQVSLDHPIAKIMLSSNNFLDISSALGIWGQLNKILEISQKVKIIYNKDYHLDTESARFDIANHVIMSNDNIHITGSLGELRASGFKGNIKEKKIYFTGPIKAIIKKQKND